MDFSRLKILQRVHLIAEKRNVVFLDVMSDGNKRKSIFFSLSISRKSNFSHLVDVITLAQQHQQRRLPFEEMGDVLLDTMQGTLVCLDSQHTIVDVSKTVKEYFGFEQVCFVGE